MMAENEQEKQSFLRKHIYKIVVIILVAIFIGGVGFGAANIFSIEGTKELYEKTEGASEYPETNEAILDYTAKIVDKALTDMPKVEMNASCSIDEDSINNSAENDQLNASVLLAVDGIESEIEGKTTGQTAEFNTSAVKFLSQCHLALNDTVSNDEYEAVVLSYTYYKCSMCTSEISVEDYENDPTTCPECGNEGTLQERHYDNYDIVVHIKPGSVTFNENDFPKNTYIEDVISEKGEGFYTVNSISKEVTDAIITINVNRLTDKINSLRYETVSDISADLKFEGAYAELGDVSIDFRASQGCNYNFTWPGISLDNHEMTVEKGSSEVIKATLTCDKPTKYTVTWTSDNEDILTVDEEGYLTTHIKKGESGDVTITASVKFDFSDEIYSDSCLVHVGVPAEGVDLNKGKLSMNVGDTFNLVAEFDPSDTTNTLCYWFTEDDSIATVDENGVITAVGKGTVTVYVVTDDGNYYSSCEVEVNS